jgi:hypothetical protein
MLAGRSSRPIIPIVDCAPYILRREVVRRERSRFRPKEDVGDFVRPAR